MFRSEYNTRNEAQLPVDVEDNKGYVKVSFEEVLDLVSKRRVVVSNGYAYVHKSKVKSLILIEFRKRLELAVIRTYEQAPLWRDDKRIYDLIESLPSQYLEHEYVPLTKNEIDISQLDILSLRSMPLCMQHLHNSLRRYHHLKHMGRLQYGLFLKGIGVSLKQALIFWESEFTKAGLNFEKDYSYSVRHNYGTVGKRTSYCPYSCTKIINMPVMAEEHHGCPYKRADKTYLRKLLMDNSLDPNDIENVIKISTQSPMEACREVFVLSHPGYQIEEIIHPNKYFDASMDYYQQKEKFMNQQPSNVANPQIKNVVIF
jgi:DNA primase large subunit